MTANPNAVEGLREVVALVAAMDAAWIRHSEEYPNMPGILASKEVWAAKQGAVNWTRDHAPQLLAEVEALRADVARLQGWLKDADTGTCGAEGLRLSEYMDAPAAEVDAYIDALRPTTETAAL